MSHERIVKLFNTINQRDTGLKRQLKGLSLACLIHEQQLQQFCCLFILADGSLAFLHKEKHGDKKTACMVNGIFNGFIYILLLLWCWNLSYLISNLKVINNCACY
jgi:hypothetical protein